MLNLQISYQKFFLSKFYNFYDAFSMINVFLENDLVNADLQNPKILALEQILQHLMMRVKNSKLVNPPWTLILDVFNQENYLKFEN